MITTSNPQYFDRCLSDKELMNITDPLSTLAEGQIDITSAKGLAFWSRDGLWAFDADFAKFVLKNASGDDYQKFMNSKTDKKEG